MKSKTTVSVVSLILLVCIVGLAFPPRSNAQGTWNWMDYTQSDLTTRSNQYYPDYTSYYSPWSTFSHRYYLTTSDLTYRYSQPTRNLGYTTLPDLRYADMLPAFSNYKYTLPPIRNLDYTTLPDVTYMDMLPSAFTTYRSTLPPVRNFNYTMLPSFATYRSSVPSARNLDRTILPDVNLRQIGMVSPSLNNYTYLIPPRNLRYGVLPALDLRHTSTRTSLSYHQTLVYGDQGLTTPHIENKINQTSTAHISLTYPSSYVSPSSFEQTPDMTVTQLHQGLTLASKVWDVLHPIRQEVQLMWDFTKPGYPVIPERPLISTTPLRTARNVGLNVLALAPALSRDLSAARQGTYRYYTSHSMETGAFLLLSKAQSQVPVPLVAIGLLTKGASSQIGRGQLAPSIDEITLYVDAVNTAVWYGLGTRLGGPKMGSLLSTAASVTAERSRTVTLPLFEGWALRSVYRQQLDALSTLNTARTARGLAPLSFEDVYRIQPMPPMNLLNLNSPFGW